MSDLNLIPYSAASYVVTGDTVKHKADLQGKYNGKLKVGPGWIFQKAKKDAILRHFKDLISEQPAPEGANLATSEKRKAEDILNPRAQKMAKTEQTEKGLIVNARYTPKSFVVTGDTITHKDTLKALGGKFGNNFSVGAGWTFPESQRETVVAKLKEVAHVIVKNSDAAEEKKEQVENGAPPSVTLNFGQTEIAIPITADSTWELQTTQTAIIAGKEYKVHVSVNVTLED